MSTASRFFLASLIALTACKAVDTPEPGEGAGGLSPEERQRVQAVVDRFVDATLHDDPDLAREVGLHEFDGQYRPTSLASAAAQIERAKAYLKDTAGLDPMRLGDPLGLDVELTRLAAERTVFLLETLERHRRIMSYLGVFDVKSYLLRDYAPLGQRIAKLLDHVEAGTQDVDAILAIQVPVQPRTHLLTAKLAMAGIREYFQKDVRTAATPALEADPALKARYEVIVPKALAKVDTMLAWVDEHLKTANDDFALGPVKFLRNIEVNEGLKLSLPELKRMAEENHQKNYDAFVEVARAIDPKRSVTEVVELVAKDHLPEAEVIPTAKKQLVELELFIREKKILTIPKDAPRCDVEVTPPFMRWNSAFLEPAGPFEKVEGSYYYLSPPDPSWSKEVQESYLPYAGDLLATSVHEVYPGHFVHSLTTRRAASRVQKIFGSYAFTEGWAHYAEQMMIDEGFGGGDKRLRLGQLSNALLRNCRFIAAIGLHTEGMTVEAAQELFEKKCFIDPGNAKQQAYRGTFDPGYLSYTLGKLQIIALRSKFAARRHEDGLGAFHDWLLSFGAPPLALVERRL